MSRTFDTSDYFQATSFSPSIHVFSVSLWVLHTTLPAAGALDQTYFTVNDGDSSDFFNLRGSDANPDQIEWNRRALGGATAQAITTNTLSSNVWHHIYADAAAVNSASVYLDGDIANGDTNTTSVSPAATTTAQVGGFVGGNPLKGRMAHLAIWDVALSTDEVQALAGGASPLRMRPTDLVHYYPMFSTVTGDAIDYGLTKTNLTENGTIVVGTDEPPIQPWFGFDPQFVTSGAPAAPVEGDGANIIMF